MSSILQPTNTASRSNTGPNRRTRAIPSTLYRKIRIFGMHYFGRATQHSDRSGEDNAQEVEMRPVTHVLYLAAAILALGMSGCLPDDGTDGVDGVDGVDGTDGTDGTDGPPGTAAERVTVDLEITDAGIDDGHPWVTFRPEARTATRPRGFDLGEFAPDRPITLSFTVAHLVDALNPDGSETSGDARSWRSLIFSYEDSEADPDADPPEGFEDGAVQAGREDADWDDLEYLGDGEYRYTFAANTDAECDNDELWGCAAYNAHEHDETDPHRYTVAIHATDLWRLNEAVADFEPASGNPLPTQRSIVRTETCTTCHDDFAEHGGRHAEATACATCHNDYNWDMGSGENLSLKSLLHKIHQGRNLLSVVEEDEPFRIYGFFTHDFSNVQFPSDTMSCAVCHSGDPDNFHGTPATNEGDNWADEQFTTKLACASCHDTEEGYTGGGFADEGHWIIGHDNELTDCTGCHEATNDRSALLAHRDEAREFAREGDLRYEILSADIDGDDLTVEWRAIHDGANIVDGEDGWELAADLRVGWLDLDYRHSDPDSERPGLPLERDGLDGATESDGVYTTTVDLSGQDFDPDVAVTLGGNVASADHPALVAANAIHYTESPRRQVVDNQTCMNCHEDRFGAFNKHGGNRHSSVEQCLVCHNNNSTDIDRRTHNPRPYIDDPDGPFPDGKDEQATNFMTMIHGIHGAADGFRQDEIWITGFMSWETWTDENSFPGRLSDCTQCHVDDSYYPVPRGDEPRGTTINTRHDDGIEPHEVEEHWKTSAGMAACSSCHDDRDAMEHMKLQGAVSGESWDQSTIDSTSWETCMTCHGPGDTADVKVEHELRP